MAKKKADKKIADEGEIHALTVRIEENLHRPLRIRAASMNSSIQALIVDHLEKWIWSKPIEPFMAPVRKPNLTVMKERDVVELSPEDRAKLEQFIATLARGSELARMIETLMGHGLSIPAFSPTANTGGRNQGGGESEGGSGSNVDEVQAGIEEARKAARRLAEARKGVGRGKKPHPKKHTGGGGN